MNVSLTGFVIYTQAKMTKENKSLVDVWIVQEGEQQPVLAFAEASALPLVPTVGELIEADCDVWVSRFNGGTLQTRLNSYRSAA